MSKQLLQKIGLEIKKLRNEKGLTIKEMSKYTGIRETYIKKIEEGNAPKVLITHISQITKSLDIDLYNFLKNIRHKK